MGGTDGFRHRPENPTDPAFQVHNRTAQPYRTANQARAFHGLHGVCHPPSPARQPESRGVAPASTTSTLSLFTPGAPLLLSLTVAGHSFLALGPENGVWP